MSKYSKFGDFLAKATSDAIHLTFDEIEGITGHPLPASKGHAAWWSNNPWNNVMTRVWLDAGFKSSRVDVAAETVDFIRTRPKANVAAPATEPHKAPRSPLFGFMKGTSTVAPGVDLTDPADPDWAKVYGDDYRPPAAQAVATDPSLNISEKIRELNTLGMSRAQIAKILNRRYQHVRNVLVADQRKAG